MSKRKQNPPKQWHEGHTEHRMDIGDTRLLRVKYSRTGLKEAAAIGKAERKFILEELGSFHSALGSLIAEIKELGH